MRSAPFSRRLHRVKRPLLLAVATGLGVATLSACGAILGSFEVDPNADAGASSSGTSGSTSSSSGSTSSSSSSGSTSSSSGSGDGGPDALVCNAPLQACGNVCADLTKDPNNCGKCGIKCGAAQCTASKCEPAKVFSGGGDTINGISVFNNTVFFSAGNKVMSCPSHQCPAPPGSPSPIVTMGFPAYGVAATPGTIVFQSAPNGSGTERPGIFACPATGCVGVPVQFTGDGLNGYKAQVPTRYGTRVGWNSGGGGIGSADCTAGVCNAPINPGNKAKAYTLNDTHIFYVENLSPNAAIKKCKHGIQPCTNELVSAGAYETVEVMAVDGDNLYWVLPGRAGFKEAKLYRCSIAANCASPQVLANNLELVSELVADANGIYWITRTSDFTTYEVQACTVGCVGGPRSISKPKNANTIATDPNFIYFGESDVIWRHAK